ncbi:MAG: orotate phosphoribosyltransferase [Legionellales bacterium]|nr:orotate phosphoribosyltransferase [Legionellales bacterium]|tara:strand:- start:477 stop:1121 length:645 start_codon:yes stop_codon:yes gene_type:complete
MLLYKRDFIEFALNHQALQFGEFTLKSGRISPYFFNAGKFQTGNALLKLGQFYAKAIQEANLSFDMIFGPAYKGIPLVCTTAISLSNLYQQNFPYAFDRKETKMHGDKGNIVGAKLSGNVLIVDDVITAGTAINYALDLIHQASAKACGVMLMLDRQEKGSTEQSAIKEISDKNALSIHSIITLDDLLNYLKSHNTNLQSYIPAIVAYREAYGC